jgi:Pyridine nucleotide-disulphide oxidoreductase
MAAAAFLRAAGVETQVFGEPMQFWRDQMPAGMYLRSAWYACNIADPEQRWRLDAYLAGQNVPMSIPVPLSTFCAYGEWFQKHWVADVDRRRVREVAPNGRGFRARLEDGSTMVAKRVIVAAGISSFAYRPPQFRGLPASMVSHSADHRDFAGFAGCQVAVIGGGQSAFESAALLHEAGAQVELIMRKPQMYWVHANTRLGRFRQLLYPRTDVGPPGLSQIVARPHLFRRLPAGIREAIAYRSIRPAAASWLQPRLDGIPITTSRQVPLAECLGDRVRLTLDDGSQRSADHVLLATGYRMNLRRYSFLGQQLLRAIGTVDGYPRLNRGLESTVSGLHFMGAPAAASFGPLTRFVSGTEYSARALTNWIRGRNGDHQETAA